jgi:hypothetical protein
MTGFVFLRHGSASDAPGLHLTIPIGACLVTLQRDFGAVTEAALLLSRQRAGIEGTVDHDRAPSRQSSFRRSFGTYCRPITISRTRPPPSRSGRCQCRFQSSGHECRRSDLTALANRRPVLAERARVSVAGRRVQQFCCRYGYVSCSDLTIACLDCQTDSLLTIARRTSCPARRRRRQDPLAVMNDGPASSHFTWRTSIRFESHRLLFRASA